MTYDLTVLGGGPAGYVPAIRAAQLGFRAVVVEEADLGGTCLNRGCIPTKALAATAEVLRTSKSASRFGLDGVLSLNYPAVARRRDMVVTRLRKGVEARLGSLGVDVVRGHGTLRGEGCLEVDGRELRSRFVLLAPGSSPALPGPFRGGGFETSNEALAWSALPDDLLIIGGGVIGCEFASIFGAFGVKVTVVEMLPSILPGLDADVKQVIHSALARSGVRILTGAAAVKATRSESGCRLELADGTALEASRMLVAAGRVPRLEGCGLEEAGVEFSPRGIAVDESLRTSLRGVFAAGDVTGKWQLAHAGSAQGLSAVESMFSGASHPVDPDAMPACIFTSPEVATAGPGEDELRTRGVAVNVRYARYIANGRAVGLNETEGFVKIIAREGDGVVVGVQIVGRDASSLIGEAALAVASGVTGTRLGEVIHPHPTLTELFMEAGEAFGPGSIHG
jgi:dihydrolipoamide dehydrogenase